MLCVNRDRLYSAHTRMVVGSSGSVRRVNIKMPKMHSAPEINEDRVADPRISPSSEGSATSSPASVDVNPNCATGVRNVVSDAA